MAKLDKVEACVNRKAEIHEHHGPLISLAITLAASPHEPSPLPPPPPFSASIATSTAAVELLQEENRSLMSRLEVVEEDNRTLVSKLEVAELGYGAAMMELRERVSLLEQSGFDMIDESPGGENI